MLMETLYKTFVDISVEGTFLSADLQFFEQFTHIFLSTLFFLDSYLFMII